MRHALTLALTLAATAPATAATLTYGGQTWTQLTGTATFSVSPGVAQDAYFYLDLCAGFTSPVGATCSPTDFSSGAPLGIYDLGGSSLGIAEGPVVNGLTLFAVQYYGTPVAGPLSISFTAPWQVWTPFYYENGDFEMFVSTFDSGPFTVTAAPVPLPAGAGLLAVALVALAGAGRWRRSRNPATGTLPA